ncbi:MAG: rod shape-determining protein [Lachnospiraceae bacterium]|jgi:rod shape-determining protein MreB|nr:rod shape-determining protein [Lachnospiraceae bacterium]MEE3377809.1 rod shape-determining protein [Lachnospiraceae bacterium]MEE3437765.1 rod shape-determining protein [Lachnospiraceae bacterium]
MAYHNVYGIDLGTSAVKIYSHKKKRTITEKNMIALKDGRQVLAVGNDAYDMFEKAPENIAVDRPVRHGRIADVAEVEFYLRTMLTRLDRNPGFRPILLFSAPSNMSEIEKMAYYEISHSGYLRNPTVYLADRAICDAVALGIPLSRTKGTMIINIGGENTEVSVIAGEQVIISRDIPLGGHALNQAIVDAILKNQNLMIGLKTARRLKTVLASLGETIGEERKVIGIDTLTGIPREGMVSSDLVSFAVEGKMCQLADEIRSFVERIPPQIRMYVLEEGIYLTGGSARIPNIDRYLRRSISCQINLSSFYEMCTVRGLEEMIQSNLLKKWAYTIRKKK